jgi:hypothetical protein
VSVSGQHRRRRGRAVYPAVVLVGVLVAGAAVLGRSMAGHHAVPSTSPPPPKASAAAVVAPAPAPSTIGAAAAAGLGPMPTIGIAGAPRRFAVSSASTPVRVTIASIGVHSALQPLGLLKDGSLQPPTKWGEAGWYAKGVVPGQVGPAVIAGHVDSTAGPAVFYRLREMRPGARVVVADRAGRSLTFLVDHINVYRKSRFPTSVVYGPTPDAQLRLVTCTGDFDAAKHSYVDNLVVSAHLAS